MRKIVILAGLMAAAASPVLAQQNGAAADAPPGAQPITRQQFIAEMDAEFVRLDGNGDGVLTEAEIAASQRAAAEREALRQNQAVFASLDSDGNGSLSPQEFARLANPDAVPITASPILARFDRDGDNVVTLLEYRIATQGNFDAIDADRDGVVSPGEMATAGIVSN